ncbi:MAG: hypothetical protein ACYTXA_10655, partial [Nostoc sp.]
RLWLWAGKMPTPQEVVEYFFIWKSLTPVQTRLIASLLTPVQTRLIASLLTPVQTRLIASLLTFNYFFGATGAALAAAAAISSGLSGINTCN